MTTLNVYKSYSFRDKDPVIDTLRTMIKDEGKSYREIRDLSGVSTATLRGWFNGKTRRPQSATVEAVGRALGYRRDWVKMSVAERKPRLTVGPGEEEVMLNDRRKKKEKYMRAILIDPHARTVTEVDHTGDYRHIYELIDARTFDVVDLGDGHTLFVDDEGLFVDDQRFFTVDGFGQPLGGKALVLDTSDDGDSVATTVDLEALRSAVRFVDVEYTGSVHHPPVEVDHPIFGRATLIRNEATFRPRKKEDEL